MRQFLKYFFASLLGTIIGLSFTFFFGIIMLASISAAVSKSKSKKDVKPNSVLELRLDYDIKERTSTNPFENFGFSFDMKSHVGLNDILKNINEAKEDDNIKGIYIDVSFMTAGQATVEAIRKALIDFKTSGKFIVAYGEIITQKAYYLASVADEIYANPVGFMDFRGFGSELLFLKGMFNKLEIEPQTIYAGKFKSATEPFRLDKMSEENREQVTFLMNDMYDHFIQNISTARNLPASLIDSIADNYLIQHISQAVQFGLIDELVYFDQVIEKLKEKCGIEEKDKLSMVSIQKYGKEDDKKKIKKDKIAILYAQGGIVDGKGSDGDIGSETYAKEIRKIRKDENVKALVFRINSGGGSALASDVILREIALAKQIMPVIATMGDVAASGGYYIACMADTILAEPNTITGSIGVFGMLFNMQDFFQNKIGVTFDGVRTGKFTDMGTTSRPLTDEERRIIQAAIDTIYKDFKERVSTGRGLDTAYVNSIAQGRIWTGNQALDNKLVDMIGGLNDAVEIAANKAGLTEYTIVEYPEQKDPLEKFMESFGSASENYILKKRLGELYPIYEKMEQLKKMNGIQARMPFDIEIK